VFFIGEEGRRWWVSQQCIDSVWSRKRNRQEKHKRNGNTDTVHVIMVYRERKKKPGWSRAGAGWSRLEPVAGAGLRSIGGLYLRLPEAVSFFGPTFP
jgi:hypothetical protein